MKNLLRKLLLKRIFNKLNGLIYLILEHTQLLKKIINFIIFKIKFEFFRKNPHHFKFYKLRIFYPKGHLIIKQIAYGSHFEPEEFCFLKSITKPNSIIFDCGANLGLICCRLALKLTSGHIFAFEPSPTPYEYLVKNIECNNLARLITPIKEACSDTENWTQFHCHSSIYCAGDGICDTGRFGPTNVINVKCTTIDNFVVNKNLKQVDIIKIDTEGNEMAILLGAKNTLIKFRPIVLFEAHPVNMATHGAKWEMLYNFILDIEYCIKTLQGKQLSFKEFGNEVVYTRGNFIALPITKNALSK